MRWSEKTDKLLACLGEVQCRVAPVLKNAINPHFKSHYATLDSVWATLSPLLNDLGLVVTQTGGMVSNRPVLCTRVSHIESGQWCEGELPLDGGKTDPQGIGSALTYQRRYSLCAMFGLILADDDGNHASPTRSQAAAKPAPQAAQAHDGYDPARVVLVRFKPQKTALPLEGMNEFDAEDALQLALWRVEHPGTDPKYQAKNKAQAEEDARHLRAYLNTLGVSNDEQPF